MKLHQIIEVYYKYSKDEHNDRRIAGKLLLKSWTFQDETSYYEKNSHSTKVRESTMIGTDYRETGIAIFAAYEELKTLVNGSKELISWPTRIPERSFPDQIIILLKRDDVSYKKLLTFLKENEPKFEESDLPRIVGEMYYAFSVWKCHTFVGTELERYTVQLSRNALKGLQLKYSRNPEIESFRFNCDDPDSGIKGTSVYLSEAQIKHLYSLGVQIPGEVAQLLEAEAERARVEAENKAKAEAERARSEAQERANREAVERAQREAEAERLRQQEVERRANEAKEAAERARREAEEKAVREAAEAERTRVEAENKVRADLDTRTRERDAAQAEAERLNVLLAAAQAQLARLEVARAPIEPNRGAAIEEEAAIAAEPEGGGLQVIPRDDGQEAARRDGEQAAADAGGGPMIYGHQRQADVLQPEQAANSPLRSLVRRAFGGWF